MIKGNLPDNLKEFFVNSIKAYKNEHSSFSNQMHRNKEMEKNLPNLPNKNFFISAFETGKNIILIDGDKNVGYVCMFVKDLLEQYEKINLQQHLEK